MTLLLIAVQLVASRNQLQDPTSLGSVLRSSEFTTAT